MATLKLGGQGSKFSTATVTVASGARSPETRAIGEGKAAMLMYENSTKRRDFPLTKKNVAKIFATFETLERFGHDTFEAENEFMAILNKDWGDRAIDLLPDED